MLAFKPSCGSALTRARSALWAKALALAPKRICGAATTLGRCQVRCWPCGGWLQYGVAFLRNRTRHGTPVQLEGLSQALPCLRCTRHLSRPLPLREGALHHLDPGDRQPPQAADD